MPNSAAVKNALAQKIERLNKKTRDHFLRFLKFRLNIFQNCAIIYSVWDVRYVSLYNTHIMHNGSAWLKTVRSAEAMLCHRNLYYASGKQMHSGGTPTCRETGVRFDTNGFLDFFYNIIKKTLDKPFRLKYNSNVKRIYCGIV